MVSTSHPTLSTVASQRGSMRALFLICTLLIVGNVMSAGWQVALKSEFGALELASFVCLSFAALVGCSFYRRGLIRAWAIPLLFAFLALREMDFQDWWFEPGLLRAEIFSAPVPIWHRLISASAMAVIAFTLWRAFWNGTRPFLAGLLRRETWALLLMASGILVILSLILDGVESNLAFVNISLSPTTLLVASYLEEVMEFGFAFSLVASLVVFARSVSERIQLDDRSF